MRGWWVIVLSSAAMLAQAPAVAPAPAPRFKPEWYPAKGHGLVFYQSLAHVPLSGTMSMYTYYRRGQMSDLASKRVDVQVYRDGDGRLRGEMRNQPRRIGRELYSGTSVQVYDPVARCMFDWFEVPGAPHTATVDCLAADEKIVKGPEWGTWQLSKLELIRTVGRLSWVNEPIGDRIIEGFETHGTRRYEVITSDDGTVERKVWADYWISPALKDWIEVDGTGMLPGGFSDKPIFTVTNIKQGEQPASLFWPPPGYRIVRWPGPQPVIGPQ